MTPPKSKSGRSGPLGRAERRLEAARVTLEQLDDLFMVFEDDPYEYSDAAVEIEAKCLELARYAGLLIEGLECCEHLAWDRPRSLLVEKVEGWAETTDDLIGRVQRQAASIYDGTFEDEDREWAERLLILIGSVYEELEGLMSYLEDLAS